MSLLFWAGDGLPCHRRQVPMPLTRVTIWDITVALVARSSLHPAEFKEVFGAYSICSIYIQGTVK